MTASSQFSHVCHPGVLQSARGLSLCRPEEPRRNLVHTTAVVAAILFPSIPSSLMRERCTVTFTMVLPLARARKGSSDDTVCLWVNFILNRDRLLTPLGPNHGFFSQWPMSQTLSQEFLLNVQFFSLKTASIHIKVL